MSLFILYFSICILTLNSQPWIGDIWEDKQIGFQINNGEFRAISDSLARWANSSKSLPGIPKVDLKNIVNNPPNVRRIMRLFTEKDWKYLFPVANKLYTYESFLQAAAKFPKFCDERANWLTESMDDICKKEMITMWSHWNQETGGHSKELDGINEDERQALYYLNEMGCDFGGCEYTSTCSGWIQEAYPCAPGKRYFGRGAKQLSYNFNYGPFSKVIFGDVATLLNDPDRVGREGWLAMASGFWFFMTPQSPKPSIHDIITGFWVPNEIDRDNNYNRGFGATISVINGGVECGMKKPQAENRIRYYKYFANYMNVTIYNEEKLNCDDFKGGFPAKGNGTIFSYWDGDWRNEKRCQLVSWQTAFSFLFDDGYTKCVRKNVLKENVTA